MGEREAGGEGRDRKGRGKGKERGRGMHTKGASAAQQQKDISLRFFLSLRKNFLFWLNCSQVPNSSSADFYMGHQENTSFLCSSLSTPLLVIFENIYERNLSVTSSAPVLTWKIAFYVCAAPVIQI